MKLKVLLILVLVLLIFQASILLSPVYAASAATIATTSASVEAGDTVYITVSLTSNPGLTYIKLNLSYDTDALTLFGVQNGEIIEDLTRGKGYVWSTSKASTKTGTLATLIFSVSTSASEGNYPITITCTEASNRNNDVDVSIQSATITVTPKQCVHEMESYSYEEPTCQKEGSHILKCSLCGETKTTTLDVVDCVAEAEADCVHDSECKFCGKVLEAAYGHKYRSHIIEPTTEDEGYTEYTCMRCGDYYQDDFLPPIQEHQHSYQVYQTVSATCTKDGYTLYKCNGCGSTYQDNVVTANGHKYSEKNIAPTCQEYGYILHTCTVCGDSYQSNLKDKIDHQYENGQCTMCKKEDESTGTAQGSDLAIVLTDVGYSSSSNRLLLATTFGNLGDTVAESTKVAYYKNSPYSDIYSSTNCPSTAAGEENRLGLWIEIPTSDYELYYIAASMENDLDNRNNYALVIVTNTSTDVCYYSHDYDAVYVNNGMHKLSCKNCDFETTAECWYPEDSLEYCVICGADAIKDSSIPVSSITLSQATATVTIGKKLWLDAIIQPSNATNQTVDWTSSNEAVAKVRWEPSGTSGYILGVSEGTATITVTTRDGSKSATCQVTVQATDVPADPNGPIIQIDNVVGHVGNTVDVKISLINNPGIALANLLVSYDQELLTLSGIQFNESMGGSWTEPSSMNSPVPLLWYNDASNISGDCTYATLSFVVNESATGGTVTPITVAYQEDEICNIDETNISFAVENGEITIVDHIAGDITGDGKLNAKDLLRLAKYFSGWDVELNTHALDVTGDGKVNAKDLLRLAKYFAGWDVELH